MVEIYVVLAQIELARPVFGHLGFVAVAAAAVVLMIRLGTKGGMLDVRRERRRCAACGRMIEGRACEECGRRRR
jgi:rRNA maturation endonuclease Nob1